MRARAKYFANLLHGVNKSYRVGIVE